VRINRIHLEEDAGKSVHDEAYVDQNASLIDLNRCGTPLIEIVSEPDIRLPEEAAEYMKKLRQILIYLGICDGNMEEGSLRCDANISIRLKNEQQFGIKTELKNMNSFRNVERALHAEIQRQKDIINSGGEVIQSTLLWDADNSRIQVMRTKEEAHDYRYFPEPDLVPVHVTENEINEIRSKIPELPPQKMKRYVDEYRLPQYDAEIITSEPEIAAYFDSVVGYIKQPKIVSNWLMGEIMHYLNDQKITISDFPISPLKMSELLGYMTNKDISGSAAKKVFEHMLESGEDAQTIIEKLSLKQVSDTAVLEEIVAKVLSDHPAQAEEFRNGKEQILGFFVGQVMKASRGQANPKVVNEILRQKLIA
jgi:aspartyl-tRNA(Asn)/glutamyl-tRNA(Gln) amidotransferase subunit B